MKTLDLRRVANGIGHMTGAYCTVCCEAAAVCLEDQNHSSGAQISVFGVAKAKVLIHWDPVTCDMRATHNDHEVATEYGACAVSFGLIAALTGEVPIQKSVKGTRIDYWMGKPDSQGDQDFDTYPLNEATARMEVSGIRNGTRGDVRRRVKEKMFRASDAESSLPLYVVVTEFSEPQTEVSIK